MQDDELLALLLSFTNAGKELYRVMDGLYADFGSFRRCFLASYTDLMRVDGMTHHGAMLILLTAKIINLRDKSQLIGRKITDYKELFLTVIKPSRDEEFWAAVYDDSDRLAAVELLASGLQGRVSVNISDIIRFVTYHNSRKFVIGHSHPDVFEVVASPHDIRVMELIGSSMGNIGVRLIGQVIVAGRNAEFFAYSPPQNK